MEEILRELESLRRTHLEAEDCWYSCPKSGECCNDDLPTTLCNCGADRFNEKLDRIVELIKHLKE